MSQIDGLNGVSPSEALRIFRQSDVGPFALRVALAFAAQDEESFLVGGAVRDLLLNHPVEELDFATSAVPERTLSILSTLGATSPYLIGEKYGTVGATLGRFHLEVTTYRAHERYVSESRKPDVVFGSSIFGDLQRRDFTINAIAIEPIRQLIVDPHGGERDLKTEVVRAVGDPEKRFDEDPLRLLRAARFATRLRFALEDGTARAMKARAKRLLSISRERIRDEYEKILLAADVARGITLLRDHQLIEHSVPQLLELDRMSDHGSTHPLSLWDHTLRVVSTVSQSPRMRWAALLHDIGKPSTRTQEADGRVRFFHHEDVGAALSRTVLSDLRYPTAFVNQVVLLVASHMQIHAYSAEWSDGAVRRLMLRLGDLVPDAIELASCDAAAHTIGMESTNAPKFAALEQRIRSLGQQRVREMQSPLSGNDLMSRYRRSPGPWIANAKRALRDEVVDGRLDQDDADGAWRFIDRWMVQGGPNNLRDETASQEE